MASSVQYHSIGSLMSKYNLKIPTKVWNDQSTTLIHSICFLLRKWLVQQSLHGFFNVISYLIKNPIVSSVQTSIVMFSSESEIQPPI